MKIFGKVFNGLTEATPQNIQIDTGAFFKNVDLSTDTYDSLKAAGKCLGATSGGGTITIKPNLRQINVDGALGRVKGMTTVTTWECSISTTMLETTAESLALALGAAKIETSGTDVPAGYKMIVGKTELDDDAYISNICWFGRILGSEEPVVFMIENALNEDGLSFSTSDQNEGKLPVTFYGYNDLTDFITGDVKPPFKLFMPDAKETG